MRYRNVRQDPHGRSSSSRRTNQSAGWGRWPRRVFSDGVSGGDGVTCVIWLGTDRSRWPGCARSWSDLSRTETRTVATNGASTAARRARVEAPCSAHNATTNIVDALQTVLDTLDASRMSSCIAAMPQPTEAVERVGGAGKRAAMVRFRHAAMCAPRQHCRRHSSLRAAPAAAANLTSPLQLLQHITGALTVLRRRTGCRLPGGDSRLHRLVTTAWWTCYHRHGVATGTPAAHEKRTKTRCA